MTINEMKDNVIRTYGFEHPATIYFFEISEHTDEMWLLEIAYDFAIHGKWEG